MRLHIIVLLALLVFTSTSVLATDAADFNKLDQYLTTAETNGFSGAVLIADNGKLRLNKGYGKTERQGSTPITADTLFDTGSVTKQFTAAAVMHLVQQGKLSTSMPISEFFNELPEDKQSITLHQLLSHSAGIANGIGARDFTHVPTGEFFNRLFAMPLYFAPGEGYAYSNAGYSILARIIELVSGMSYEEYLQKALFEPAGMHNTGYLNPVLAKLPAAAGYLFGEVETGSTRDKYFEDAVIAWPLKGNGGMLSTMNDMYLWAQALQSESVLAAKYRDQLFEPHVAENEEGTSHYGYGWAVMPTPRETTFIGHNGSNGTYYFDFRWLPDEQILILFASNALVESTMALPYYIEQYLFEKKPLPAFETGLTSQMVGLSLSTAGSSERKKAVLQKTFASKIDNKRILNRAGLRLMDNERYNDAIGLLLLNVELYSDDGNLWDSLGEAYFVSGQYALAKQAFTQAIERKPAENCFWCDNSAARLQQISEAD